MMKKFACFMLICLAVPQVRADEREDMGVEIGKLAGDLLGANIQRAVDEVAVKNLDKRIEKVSCELDGYDTLALAAAYADLSAEFSSYGEDLSSAQSALGDAGVALEDYDNAQNPCDKQAAYFRFQEAITSANTYLGSAESHAATWDDYYGNVEDIIEPYEDE